MKIFKLFEPSLNLQNFDWLKKMVRTKQDQIFVFNHTVFNWIIHGLFSFRLFNTAHIQLIINEVCQWLDSNHRSLELEVTTLSTEPEPLPVSFKFVQPFRFFRFRKFPISWNQTNPDLISLKSFIHFICTLSLFLMGSGCGSVSRAVTSDSRGLRFESGHR